MSQSERPYRIGFLGTIALVGAVLVFMYAGTFQTDQWLIVQAVLFCAIGILFACVMVGVKFEPFQMRDLVESIVWTAVSFCAIWVINHTVPFRLEVAPISERLFSVLMGVAEESFFRVFLCTFIFKFTRQGWLAIGVSSAVWAIYHLERYGGWGMGAFVVIFLAGCVLGWVMLYSKMGDGVIFAHGAVNFLV